MSIYVIGINHKSAPITIREKVYFATDKLLLYLQDLTGCRAAREAVLLSTCNRSELYAEGEDLEAMRHWFFSQTSIPRQELEPFIYVYKNEQAVQHIMGVACGLDSMILGEPQILGQLKEAYSESCSAGAVQTVFHRLFQCVFTFAKEIRTATAIGACPVSVASAAVHFAKQAMPSFTDANILLLGAGDTTALLMRYLTPLVKHPLAIVNRSLENAALLASNEGGFAYDLNALPDLLKKADVVFSATGSPIPLVTREIMSDIIDERKSSPLIFIDVAVPRDIAPEVADFANVEVFCIDNLKAIIEKNRQGREHAAIKAAEMIRKKSKEFIEQGQSHEKVMHTIRAYRNQVEEIRDIELLKAKQQLLQGDAPEKVLESFANAYTQKLLHVPSVQLRQAGVEGRFELLRFAKQLFAIPDPEVERL